MNVGGQWGPDCDYGAEGENDLGGWEAKISEEISLFATVTEGSR